MFLSISFISHYYLPRGSQVPSCHSSAFFCGHQSCSDSSIRFLLLEATGSGLSIISALLGVKGKVASFSRLLGQQTHISHWSIRAASIAGHELLCLPAAVSTADLHPSSCYVQWPGYKGQSQKAQERRVANNDYFDGNNIAWWLASARHCRIKYFIYLHSFIRFPPTITLFVNTFVSIAVTVSPENNDWHIGETQLTLGVISKLPLSLKPGGLSSLLKVTQQKQIWTQGVCI